ncbi:Strn4 [Lemmus lemmus]
MYPTRVGTLRSRKGPLGGRKRQAAGSSGFPPGQEGRPRESKVRPDVADQDAEAGEFQARGLPGLHQAPGGLRGGQSLLVQQIEEQIKRNAAGKDGKERLGGSGLEQIPFLQNCEDEDSDEDEELDSVQHKKQQVRLPPKALVPEMEDDSEDAINEFDFLDSGEDGEGSPDPRRCAAEGNPHDLESRLVKLQGILADLRNVYGLPPKVSIPPPDTPQPWTHEDS